ncbi:YtxH domain-containing protein [Cellulomonas sp. HZM]|uniref:YtxH domain-containing protein n=1 Tax=Cellulomonas sp. HZM TaxID=1454010 RepID=UPI000553A065|nr:YtxH domain-containing protein [Cellulomonas sp. HZM]
MKGKVAFVAGAGLGYLLGTRAGRGQFEKIKGWASDMWADPRVQGYVHDAQDQAMQFAKDQGSALKDKAFDAAKQAVAGATGSSASSSQDRADYDPDEILIDPDAPDAALDDELDPNGRRL